MAEASAILAIVIFGFGLGASLAAPPGPVLVLAADRTAHRGFWPGLIVTIGATLGDATHALLMGFGVLPLITRVEHLPETLAIGGGLLLWWMAWGTWQKARRPPDLTDAHGDDHGWSKRWGVYGGGLVAGYLFALTSPFNLAWWLSAGTALFRDYGPVVFYGFFAGILTVAVVYVALVRFAARRVQGVVQWVGYGSTLLLAVFGALVLWNGIRALMPAA